MRPKEIKTHNEQNLVAILEDRRAAHDALFQGPRHKNQTPPFHKELINDFHSKIPRLCWIVFRGGGKSTIAEEGLVIMAGLREFHHAFIIGASQPKAQERLHAIRRIFEKNEFVKDAFGDLRGRPWGDDRLELANGVVLIAMGRGQAIRGTKAEDFRPDLIVVDDLEDAQSVATPEGRKKVSDWFHDELLPSGDVDMRVRVLANDMHPECIANELDKPGSGFVVRRYPWEFTDDNGVRQAIWPNRFPLEEIDLTRERYYSQGKAGIYAANYMCRSERAEDKPFRRDMFRYAGVADTPPITRSWQATYVMVDPARSVRDTAATTGIAVWSRIANRLVVWESTAKRLMPDEIMSEIFRLNNEYHPVKIGFEEDGLNEWALQPLRQEQARRGVTLPLVPCRAPKSKMDFIRALQFGFNARETIFAKPLPELEAQLLGFPTGHIDAPNALAYEHHPKLSPGAPIYEDFLLDHVIENLEPMDQTSWLCLNGTQNLATGILLQVKDGTVKILMDWVREGDPGNVAPDIVREANLESTRVPRLAIPPQHFERYGNIGLVQACRKFSQEIRTARLPETGRDECRRLLRTMPRGVPALTLSSRARWTLNGFAGGYTRAVRNGQLMEYPEEGTYRILMEGLESFLGMMHSTEGTESQATNATSADGRRFYSAIANRGAS